jgi:hypothetical protein
MRSCIQVSVWRLIFPKILVVFLSFSMKMKSTFIFSFDIQCNLFREAYVVGYYKNRSFEEKVAPWKAEESILKKNSYTSKQWWLVAKISGGAAPENF